MSNMKVSLSLPIDLVQKLRQIAESDRRTLSVTIELLLEGAVSKRRPFGGVARKEAQEPAQPRLAMVEDWEADDDAPTAA